MKYYQEEIVRMLNEGKSRDKVFSEIEKNFYFKPWNKQVRQELANQIAQVDQLNVYATGVVPS